MTRITSVDSFYDILRAVGVDVHRDGNARLLGHLGAVVPQQAIPIEREQRLAAKGEVDIRMLPLAGHSLRDEPHASLRRLKRHHPRRAPGVGLRPRLAGVAVGTVHVADQVAVHQQLALHRDRLLPRGRRCRRRLKMIRQSLVTLKRRRQFIRRLIPGHGGYKALRLLVIAHREEKQIGVDLREGKELTGRRMKKTHPASLLRMWKVKEMIIRLM